MVSHLSSFLHCIVKLKSVKRAGWVSKVKVESAESVADHTFSMCAMAMLLSDIVGLDTPKVMKMVILHDLAESIIGDYMPGDIDGKQKIAEEKEAMGSILADLPAVIGSDYEKIWLEYLENATEIAKFVHRIDKLEMALQANQYSKQGYNSELLTQFFKSAIIAVGDEGDIVSEILNSLRPSSAK